MQPAQLPQMRHWKSFDRKKSLHIVEDAANFPSRSFSCYLAREIFLPREGDHFCYFGVFGYTIEIIIEILLHPFTFQ